jgi:CrcB protein
MVNLFWIALAGALGSVSRYGLSTFALNTLGWDYPWGTTLVNVVGCFFFGLIWAMTRENTWLDGETRTIILVGFMGAFTTFSTFIFEIDQLLKDGKYTTVGIDIVVQISVGLALLMCGIKLGKYIIS